MGDQPGGSTGPRRVGQRIAAQLVRLCCEQHRLGRYYLLEGPAARYARIFDDVLAGTLKNAGGKLVSGDLCAYGCRSQSSQRPVRRLTNWLSNSESLLNFLGRRCRCAAGPWTKHERDESAEGFPSGLLRAVCRGIQDAMRLDYAVHMSYHDGKHAAMAAGDLDDEGDAEMEEEYSDDTPSEEPWQDEWEFVGEDRLLRIHRVPRQRLFLPLSTTAPPVALDRLLPQRRTSMKLQEGTHRELNDSWHHGRVEQKMDFTWTGATEFTLRRPRPEQAKEERPEPPPEPRDPDALPSDVDWDDYEPSEAGPVLDAPPSLPRGQQYDPQASAVPVDSEPEQAEEERPEPPPEPRDPRALRRGRRQRQLQRGFWQECEEEAVLDLLEATAEHLRESGAGAWFRLGTDNDLGRAWVSAESGRAEVSLILCSLTARRMKKPQPHAGPIEVPLRKSFLLLNGNEVLTTDWEDWNSMAPSAQVRPLVAQGRILYVVLYGKEIGEGGQPIEAGPGERQQVAEASRQRKWQALPRELKLAIRRVHVNLGHAPQAAMLRALRISRASETAIKACRLFRCPDCPRLTEPRLPRPSKLPVADEFNVQIGLDIFSEKDAKGHSWSWLNVFDQGTLFQVCSLMGQTHANPSSAEVLRAFTTSWTDWAGFPERGVVTDRAKYFLADFAEEIADHGCNFDTAAKASPWQIGQIERHGGLWKETFRKLCWDQQISSHEEVLWATSATNQAKNSLVRKSGFSPAQWVLGKDVRLPASLADEDEVGRVGAQALADTPGTRFHRKNQIRMAARENFTKAANSEAIRRAELRQVRPSRGPFPAGTYVFYYDGANKQPGPNCWRGIARVVGREGQSTIWLSHRGILIAVSPEHLSLAHDQEVEQWMVVANEHSLVDAMPASGGSGFLDLRQAPKPPALHDEDREEGDRRGAEPELGDDDMRGPSDQGGSSTSIERQASERDAGRMRKSSEFFTMKERQRRAQREAPADRPPEVHGDTPGQPSGFNPTTAPMQIEPGTPFEDVVPPLDVPDYDPDLDDYHQAGPGLARQLSPIVDDPEAEANEREAKRQRVIRGDESAHMVAGRCDVHAVINSRGYLKNQARDHYRANADYYGAMAVSEPTFLFSCKRNCFDERYEALAATSGKKGRKEVKLNDLLPAQRELFTKPGGSDEKEWKAWLSKGACEVLSLEASREIRKSKADLIIPTRWVRTNKNDNIFGAEFLAKSRLVVQGFKDRSLGQYRRDAPTASAIAESICLAVCANKRFLLFAKDIKNAYFSGKSMAREIYLEPPKGGLPDVAEGQLLQAKKAIYGFAEAARMFWLALKEHLQEDGWEESRLEPALFYYRVKQVLQGILVTHVDDLEGGINPDYLEAAFKKSSVALEFATNHYKDFIFRGREMKQHESGNIDVMMRNYALSLKTVPVQRDRRQQLEEPLTEKEMEIYQSSAGELGWLTRQLRCDLAYENGVAQRAKLDARVADLIRLKQFIGAARRGADFHLRFWADVSLKDSVVVHLSDAGHANGTPEHDEKVRYRSVGGYFILLANKGILEGREVRANVLAFSSGQTKRVCRSTLAAEASHLAEAVEAGDWIIVVLEEALTGKVDLRNWPEVIQQRLRIYVTDARSVFDYLQKDATSTSSDKRMAIEGALLRETVRQPGADVRWIDGQQNMSNVLTKSGADKEGLKEFLRTGMIGLTQSEANRKLKAKQQEQRAKRKVIKKANDEAKSLQREQQLQATIEQLEANLEDDDGDQPKNKEGV